MLPDADSGFPGMFPGWHSKEVGGNWELEGSEDTQKTLMINTGEGTMRIPPGGGDT